MKPEKTNWFLSRISDPKQRRFLHELKDKLTKKERLTDVKKKGQ
jgi:hypothetical protein